MTHATHSEGAAEIAVVVLNWNGWPYLEGCLDALRRQTYPNFEVVVVDNGSTDGSPERVAEHFPWVRLICNSGNLGFAAANNQAIRTTSSQYVATLNNDTVVEPDWLAALVSAAETDPDIGAVASKMVFAHDPNVINSCGIGLDPAGIAWDLLGGHPASTIDHPREVFGACAGAALYRRAMFEEIGLFEEAFFAYMEDVDLAWRAREAGWRAVLAPGAVVRHVHSGTLGDASPRKRFLLGRNKLWTIARCLPRRDLWQLPIILLYEAGAVALRVTERDWAAVAGRFAALAGLLSMLRKRAQIQVPRAARPPRPYYEPLVPPWRVPERYQHLAALPGSVSQKSDMNARERLRAGLLQGIARALVRGQATRQFPAHGDRQLRVVALRPDHLGDVLLSRPAIERLRSGLPNAEITVVAGPWGAASLLGLNCRVATFPFPGFERSEKVNLLAPYAALVAFAGHLARGSFDAAVLLRPDHWWGALACSLAGIPVRVGQALPLQKSFLTHAIPNELGEAAPMAALRAARATLEAVGANAGARSGLQDGPAVAARSAVPESGPSVSFAPSQAASRWAKDWVAANVSRRPAVALHPGAGAGVKLWPSHRWSAVVEALTIEGSWVGLTGGEADRPLLADIQDRVSARLPWAVGLSWDQLAALYAQVDLVIGVDSGPLHLATAVGTPTVRLYGPTDVAVYGPAGDRGLHRSLISAVACAPCGNLVAPPCGYQSSPPCLGAISIEEIVAAVRQQLVARVPEGSGDAPPSAL